MKIPLRKTDFFVFVLFAFTGIVSAQTQYTITGSVNSSTLSCSAFTDKTIIYIGDGVNPSKLIMNANLNLNTCGLGAIQFIIRNNSVLEYPSATNNDLSLPAESSIIIEAGSPGGNIVTVGDCSNSDLIKIGGASVASCQGAGQLLTFDEVVANGGYNVIRATPSPASVCGSGSFIISASVTPTPTASTTYKWYATASGESPFLTTTSSTSPYSTTYSPSISATTTYYIEATTDTFTTPRRAVTLTVNNLPTISGALSVCAGSTSTLSGSGTADATTPWTSAAPTVATISSTGVVSGISEGTSVITYKDSNGCIKNATITVVALPNNITNGFFATTICAGGSPQLTFDAEDSSFSTPYSITYKNDVTLVQYTVSIPTAAAYSFTPGDNPTSNANYTLVSISNASCTRTTNFGDSGATQIIRPVPTATISGTKAVCEGAAFPNITISNPQTVNITVTYTINGGANTTVDVNNGSSVNFSVSTATAGIFAYNLVSVVYRSTPTCSNTLSGNATVTVNPNLPAGVSIVASPSGAICSGTSVTFTASPTNGGTIPTYQWKINGTNVGINSPTYTSSTLANADLVTCAMTSNANPCLVGSPVTSSGITMAVNSRPEAPSIITITPPNCILSTGSVNLGNLPAGVWTLNPGNISGNTNSIIVSGLTSGTTYNFVVTNSSGCTSLASSDVVMPSPATSTWNGTSWSPSAPTINNAIVFAGDYSVAADLSGCSCQVNSGNVVIESTHTLTITNAVNVVSPGTLTFENGASLVQTANIVNTGDITYKRETTPISKFDYTYWSSPVSPQSLYNVSPNTSSDKFFSFDALADDWQQEDPSAIMDKGIGYIIRGPQNYDAPMPPNPYRASFVGVPNNGNLSISSISSIEASYLLGNPYPSALDADSFLRANSGVLEGTLYFWTHNTSIQLATNITNGTAGSGVYAYTSDDYASYNLTGGTATKIAAAGTNSNIPSGKIASGQAFFATTKAAGSVVFNNGMRVGVGGTKLDNSQFFKNSSNAKAVSLIEKSRLWLDLYNEEGAFKQTLVGYVSGASNDYDSNYDGETFDGNEFVDFYSIMQDKNLVIQGRALPFEETDEVPLGYKTNIEGDFSIAISQTDGLFETQNVFVEDKLLNVVHDLKIAPYNFATAKGIFNDRFVIRYTNKTLGIGDFDLLENGVSVSNKNKEIKINSSDEMMEKILIYDVLGRQIYGKAKVNDKELRIRNLLSSQQLLLVKIVLQNGQTVTKKMIY